MKVNPFVVGALVAAVGSFTPARATDADGPDDCARDLIDFGDAPEGIPAYPSGMPGHFPTCIAAFAPGTREIDPSCPPPSTPPGPTGFVRHVQFGPGFGNYWLGCYTTPQGLPFGIDSEPDGKVNFPAAGVSACDPSVPTDCILPLGAGWDQDECFLDGSDAGVPVRPPFIACRPAAVPFDTFNCLPVDRPAFLNILVDFNEDGDWNDTFDCDPGTAAACALEWAVQNVPILLPPACGTHVSPTFLVGPRAGLAWMRISLTEDPVPPDYPWNGSVGFPGESFLGGETEDYVVQIQEDGTAVPEGVRPGSWGRVKGLYR